MGSKRSSSSSRNRSKDAETDPLVDLPADGNPSKSSKKPKPSFGLRSPTPPADSPAPSEKSRRKAAREENDNDPRKASTATSGGGGGGGSEDDKPALQSAPLRWANDDVLKLLKAVAAFRFRNGVVPTPSTVPVFFEEIKDWAPKGLSEKKLIRKLADLRRKFQASRAPGSDDSEFDRTFHKLASEAWGKNEFDFKSKGNGSVKKKGKADAKVGKEKANKERKNEKKEEEEDDEARGGKEKVAKVRREDKSADEKKETVKKEKVSKKEEKKKDEEGENAHGKTESIEMEEDDTWDGNDQSPYKYLKFALEEFWTERNLDMNTLKLALQRVDPVQANHLNKRFLELFKEELKFKIEKNQVDITVLDVIQDGAQLD
ncbi:hypothetical protein AXF42_Ash001411 [Apostasia shenzhenica]|uniref:Glabrous enhancer-binding protein-like DBD domain-containing protein n=1 Tax=Apostasia shenzhenica TaxID=1088818 RepID=A0A2I0AUU6_9ASPA|nr:hypothetical protein AXF42_Ash001411 [Apostasia shenzhenica]